MTAENKGGWRQRAQGRTSADSVCPVPNPCRCGPGWFVLRFQGLRNLTSEVQKSVWWLGSKQLNRFLSIPLVGVLEIPVCESTSKSEANNSVVAYSKASKVRSALRAQDTVCRQNIEPLLCLLYTGSTIDTQTVLPINRYHPRLCEANVLPDS